MRLNYTLIGLFIISFLFAMLYLIKAYDAMLIGILFIGFYSVVVANKKFSHIKEYIERFY